jgi:hypothetical protein
MAITTAICKSFKAELLAGIHDLDNDVLKAALYTDAADLGETTAYSATNEASGGGYTAGGMEIEATSGYPALNGNFAEFRFDPIQWPASSITARGMLLYNASKADRAIAVYDFGSNYTSVNGTFEVAVPLVDLVPITAT